MKIDTLELVSFESLSPGDAFQTGPGAVWLRVVGRETCDGREINAVCLMDGFVGTMDPTLRVQPLPNAMVVVRS